MEDLGAAPPSPNLPFLTNFQAISSICFPHFLTMVAYKVRTVANMERKSITGTLYTGKGIRDKFLTFKVTFGQIVFLIETNSSKIQ